MSFFTASPSPHSRLAVTLAVIPGALGVGFSAVFIMMALPNMVDELGISTATSHWLITAMIATSTLTMLLTATLVDRFGLRNSFLVFNVLFIVVSIIAGSQDNVGVLIGCRALQGAAMGVLFVLALLALYEVYPIEERGKAGAIYGLGTAMAPTLGPTLSGYAVDHWGWQSVFFAPLPLSLLSLILCWRVLPNKTITSTKPFDKVGFVLLTTWLFGLIGGLGYLHLQHWPRSETLAFFVTLSSLGLVLWFHQTKHPHPLLPLSLFRYPVFSLTSVLGFLFGFGVWGSALIIPLFLQRAIGMSPSDAGLVMLPSGLAMCLMLPLGGRLTDSSPAHRVVMIGLLSFGLSFFLLGFGVAGGSYIFLAALIVLSRGIGLGIMNPGMDAIATRAVPQEHLNEGLAIFNFIRQLGGALSPTLILLLLEWRIKENSLLAIPGPESNGVLAGFQQTLLVIATLFLLSIITTRYMRPNRTNID